MFDFVILDTTLRSYDKSFGVLAVPLVFSDVFLEFLDVNLEFSDYNLEVLDINLELSDYILESLDMNLELSDINSVMPFVDLELFYCQIVSF